MRTVEIEIDIDDFLSAMNSRDYDYLLKCLKEDGYVDESVIIKDGVLTSKLTLYENSDYYNALLKLSENKHRLSTDEEELIINLGKKL
jgi:hypothetical protein